ncbi:MULTISPECIES: hypothetical protein [Paenibacillus]|uniref:Uncharacterized protein n=1 Tax=Paenibacillus vini TaxID=1476024 RepID=A0ABQ4M587_9BACL|nr:MULTISPECIES: hypothetical protein [Paenibacillus]GIP51159.1 hypothetical protein J42TS3_01940 [Paenibacillus vini]
MGRSFANLHMKSNNLSEVEFMTFKSKADREIQDSLLKLGFQN